MCLLLGMYPIFRKFPGHFVGKGCDPIWHTTAQLQPSCTVEKFCRSESSLTSPKYLNNTCTEAAAYMTYAVTFFGEARICAITWYMGYDHPTIKSGILILFGHDYSLLMMLWPTLKTILKNTGSFNPPFDHGTYENSCTILHPNMKSFFSTGPIHLEVMLLLILGGRGEYYSSEFMNQCTDMRYIYICMYNIVKLDIVVVLSQITPWIITCYNSGSVNSITP